MLLAFIPLFIVIFPTLAGLMQTASRVTDEKYAPVNCMCDNFRLSRLDVTALRLRFAFLRRFNTLVASLLPLTTLSLNGIQTLTLLISRYFGKKIEIYCGILSGALRSCRQLIFTSVKLDFVQVHYFDLISISLNQRILDYTAEDCRPPSVTLERMTLTQVLLFLLRVKFY